MLPMECGALGTLDSLATETAADGDANRDSDGQPNREVSSQNSGGRAQRRSERDA